LSRHGDRSPQAFELLPNQPYSDLKYWPMGYGQLTNVKNFLRTVLQFWFLLDWKGSNVQRWKLYKEAI
ncbi:hypothetical protein B4U80_14758, partial [Leptotrombidium deliense]